MILVFMYYSIIFIILDNIKTFFDNFLNTDKIIFSEMKQTFNDEQNNFIQNL